MHPEEVLVPLGVMATIFGYFFLKSRENMALIEKGINPRKNYGGPKPYDYMKYALLLIGAGTGLLTAYLIELCIPEKGISTGPDDPALYFALIAIGGGIGMFSAYKIEKRHWVDNKTGNDDKS